MAQVTRTSSHDRGSALITCLILGTVLISIIVWFTQIWITRSKVTVMAYGSKKAQQYADSGINLAAQFLKSPTLQTSLPLLNGTTTFSVPLNQGRVAVTLYRDNNLVDAYATGYFYIAASKFVDPLNSQPAQYASVYAKFQLTNVGQFMLAVPGSLTIGQGTNAAGGIVYANDLKFDGIPSGPTTTVGAAYYHNSVLPSANPSWVSMSTSPAQQLPSPPNFASLDAGVRSLYQNLQTTAFIPTNPIVGTLACPTDTYVIFYNGNLDIGTQTQAVTVTGVCAIYATGDVTIHNNFGPAGGDTSSWAAVLSEGIIHLGADTPQPLSVSATFVTNVAFMADGTTQKTGNLTITGGIVSMQAMGVGDVWTGNRTYNYYSSPSPNLLLPNFTDQLEYRITHGAKY
jgi:hypothetical protein